MKIKLAHIEMDTSIQCRATIDTALVNEYAERMAKGDKFPPIQLFGNNGKLWIGDGWHRIMAANQIGAVDILAEVKPGGRIEALKCALSANSLHGFRRTNADKRRCVEIALREFPKLSSRAIAEMAGVSAGLIDGIRLEQLPIVGTSKRMGQDGKEYPATRTTPSEDKSKKQEEDHEEELKSEHRKVGPPCDGMQFARLAIMDLEQIRSDDIERHQAFEFIKGWIKENETKA